MDGIILIMAININAYSAIRKELNDAGVQLVAVSKTKPVEDILALYELGQRDFGENYVQELVEKAALLPKDIRWHFIGHLQTNKVKLIAPFVQLIHGADSLKLLEEINKQAAKSGRVIDCLLQVHIAEEETKFGLNEEELNLLISKFATLSPEHVRICGLMGMASFSDDREKISHEFRKLKQIFDQHTPVSSSHIHFHILSMGMSGDYKIAVEAGSNLVRIGSLLFGERTSH